MGTLRAFWLFDGVMLYSHGQMIKWVGLGRCAHALPRKLSAESVVP